MKVSLFLMTKKGYNVLKSIVDNNLYHLIEKVVVARDHNILNDYYQDIVDLCINNNIIYASRKDANITESQYAIAVSWRWLIDLKPSCNLIVLHDSLLPKYRGFAPLVNMLINRENRIGVTALFASEEYDCGDIIEQESVGINYPIKISEAIEKIVPLYSKLVIGLLEKINKNIEIKAVKQNDDDATFSLWRDDEDYSIDWNLSSSQIQQIIFSVGYPYNGAYTILNGEKFRIKDCELYPDKNIENRLQGKQIFISEGYPVIVCGQGLLKLTHIEDSDGILVKTFPTFRARLN